ncbi:MAG: hypothetical protein E5Y34_30910 [Mesorhizobium sp.]|uniref:hypothetical protein n=1 Tax=Mesorhizobium sp. TaxID=1871066 RepID=UPI001218FF88|nr:hypothetical protein [Mesorhizobium sp.]TIM94396.1 MAG: hypothetical protein E5Y34_30910 [Mesorhizobium sp.]
MSKREARLDRKLEKLLKDQQKAVRLIEVVKAEQEPRVEFQIAEQKAPRSSEDPVSIMQLRMEYRVIDHADRHGEWAWGQPRNWCDPTYGAGNACLIRSTMIEMSALYWSEILAQSTGGKERHRKHHPQSWDSLCQEAQERWLEIGREEDELFRFRTGGKERIWGFREGHVFNVVWWDAEHQIYPVEKS